MLQKKKINLFLISLINLFLYLNLKSEMIQHQVNVKIISSILR